MEGVCGIVLHPERFLLLWLGFPGDKGWAAAPPGLAVPWHWQGHLVWLFQLRAAVPIQPSCHFTRQWWLWSPPELHMSSGRAVVSWAVFCCFS